MFSIALVSIKCYNKELKRQMWPISAAISSPRSGNVDQLGHGRHSRREKGEECIYANYELPQNDLLHFFLIQEHLHGILNVKNYSMRSSTFIHFFSSEKRSIEEFVL